MTCVLPKAKLQLYEKGHCAVNLSTKRGCALYSERLALEADQIDRMIAPATSQET
jgi:hypothetical protein